MKRFTKAQKVEDGTQAAVAVKASAPVAVEASADEDGLKLPLPLTHQLPLQHQLPLKHRRV